MADDQQHTLQLIARHLITAMQPLIDAGGSLGAFMRLMGRMGFFASDLPAPYRQLATSVGDALTAVEHLPPSPGLQDLHGLLEKAKALYDAIQLLASGPVPTDADAAAYAEEIGERLFELLLTDYLATEQPGAYGVLSMLNVIAVESVAATPTRPSFVRTHFRWAELPKIVSDPQSLPQRVYKWGQPDFDDGLALEHLARLGLELRLPVAYRTSNAQALAGYLGLGDVFPPPSGRSLVLPFFYAHVAGHTVEGALALQRLPAQGAAMPGLILEPRLPSEMPLQFPLAPTVQLTVRAGTNLGELFGITLRPPNLVELRYPLAPGTPPPAAGLGIGVSYKPSAPVALLGDPKGSRIELAAAALNLTADLVGSEISLGVGADLQGLKVVIAPGDGDSFLRTIIGDRPASIDVPLGVEWTQKNGIRFKGSAAFEVTLHPHLQLGPVRVNDVTVKLSAPSGGPPLVRLELGAAIAGELGPLKFVVDGIGLAADATFEPGNAGPFGLALGFKPPNGVGLEIDAGGFTGGGFLRFDTGKGEYSGALELTFHDTISVRAIGILSTKIPDGGSGFSLLILIVSEFPPIQLSFGFTLLGIGGLLGLNRAVALEALQAGVRDGSLNSILFPTDVVANAPRIIGDLQRVFPPQNGLFLVGPMAELGWGTPTLISLELGLMLDLPRPIVVIVGILRAALPADEIPILFLQVNFVGIIDFGAGRFQFDASLYDSHVLSFPLTGDMAVRVYWKADANLLLTVGGFNPAYTPPPMNLPQLARLAIVLFQGNPSVRAEGYFAITSNTVQFGARLEVSYSLSVFSVNGFLALDVLINFEPFHFVAEVAGMIAVKTGSHTLFAIQLQLTLEGPTPWHAKGQASFDIGFIFTITIHVDFDVTFGDVLETLLAAADVLEALAAALTNLGNWRPRLPASANQSVTVRSLPDPAQTLLLHPCGFLEISQKVAPLGIAIQRFGATTPATAGAFRIVDVKVGGDPAPTAPTREEFAPAQFFTMSDAEKLSRPSFAEYDSGVAIGGDAPPETDWMRAREVAYNVIYVPQNHPARVRFTIPAELAQWSIGGAAISQSPLSRAKTRPSALSERVGLERDRYAVVSTQDLSLHAPDMIFDSATAADQAVRSLLLQQPDLRGAIQTVPTAVLPLEEVPV